MRSVCLALALVVGGTVGARPAAAQFMIDHEKAAGGLRGLHASVGRPIKRSFESDEDAKAVFREILAATGLPGVADRIIVRASAETANAEAWISNDEKRERYIFYNSTFMQELRSKTGKYWSLVFVVAHEVGHHIAGHLDFQGQNHQVELEADRYGGFILGRMGALHAEAVAAAGAIGSAEASESHPAREQRVQAVSLGWTDGSLRPGIDAKAGRAPGATPASAPVRPSRPDPLTYSLTLWPKGSLKLGQTVSADTPHGRLTCTSRGPSTRPCAWR